MTSSSLHKSAHALVDGDADFTPLLDMVGDSSFVLLGEGSHGTHEFYRQRAEITKRLIVEKGFSAVAVEADWPDAYPGRGLAHRLTRIALPGWIRGSSSSRTPLRAKRWLAASNLTATAQPQRQIPTERRST